MKKENPVVSKQNVQSQPVGRTNNVILTEPLVFADSKDIVDDIKRNKVVIINLSKLDIETSDRLLDFISGGIYALGARLKLLGKIFTYVFLMVLKFQETFTKESINIVKYNRVFLGI